MLAVVQHVAFWMQFRGHSRRLSAVLH